MAQLHLRLRPGNPLCPLERYWVVMLVGKSEHVFARASGDRPEGDACRGAARDSHAPAQAEDGIEYGARGI